jgi:hypothetical protein
MSSSGIYSKLYQSICEDRKKKKHLYGRSSGLHAHHIIPSHAGGADEESNLTYLTPREHSAIHFLLWKINGDVNDLRACYMLGANLSVEKRRIIGKWCYENKIGFHKFTPEERSAKSKEQQLERHATGNTNEWDFWASPEGRKERASMGGKASAASENHSFKNFTPEQRSINAYKGGKASPTLPAYNIITHKIKKFFTETDRELFVEENVLYQKGHPPRQLSEDTIKERTRKTKDTRARKVGSGTEYKTSPVSNGIETKMLQKSEIDAFLESNKEWYKGLARRGKPTGKSYNAKPVTINGKRYASMREACAELFPGYSKSKAYSKVKGLISSSEPEL